MGRKATIVCVIFVLIGFIFMLDGCREAYFRDIR